MKVVDLTGAQKRDRRFYKEDTVLVLNRNAGGFQKGQTCRLVHIADRGLVLEGADKIRTVQFRFADRPTVCQPREITLAAGDRLQLKANAKTRAGQRLANGELVTVKKITDDGRIALTDGRILEKDYQQFVRGFAITSYASQGSRRECAAEATIRPKGDLSNVRWSRQQTELRSVEHLLKAHRGVRKVT